MKLTGIFRNSMTVCLTAGLAILNAGCVNMAMPEKKPAPVIIWPKPPDIPRISFVNSISRPGDLGITESVFQGFLRYLAGNTETPMVNPYGLAVDAENRLYVVDYYLKKIHVYDQTEKKHRSMSENGAALVSPIGIAVDDKRGRIYVTDSAQALVRIFDKAGGQALGEIRSGGMGRPTGIAVNAATGELLVVDTVNSGILRYSLNDHRLKGIIGLEGNEIGRFHSPTHIAVSRAGNIFVTDSLNFRIQVFNPEGGFMRSFGAPGNSPGYFSRPKGVAVDSDGNIYVVDALFDNVQVFDGEGRLLMSFGGPGRELGEFWLPSGIFIDSKDMIYISDSYNNRVQIFQYLKDGELP